MGSCVVPQELVLGGAAVVQSKRHPRTHELPVLAGDAPLKGDGGAPSQLALSWRVVPFVQPAREGSEQLDAAMAGR